MNALDAKTSSQSRPAPRIPASLHLKRIVVPIDFSNSSVAALRYATSLAAQVGAAVHLLHVLEPPSLLDDLANLPLFPPDDEALLQSARKRLQHLARRRVRPELPVFTYARTGKPFEQIALFAKHRNMDLIVIASHGRSGIDKLLLGSTTDRVVRCAPCPVLVVRKAIKSANRTEP